MSASAVMAAPTLKFRTQPPDSIVIGLNSRVHNLIKRAQCKAAPVDLVLLSRLQGIEQIELRAMLAEGVVTPSENGFHVYLKANEPSIILTASPGPLRLTRRQRFTLAHEIAHTFFYDTDRLPPRSPACGVTDAQLDVVYEETGTGYLTRIKDLSLL